MSKGETLLLVEQCFCCQGSHVSLPGTTDPHYSLSVDSLHSSIFWNQPSGSLACNWDYTKRSLPIVIYSKKRHFYKLIWQTFWLGCSITYLRHCLKRRTCIYIQLQGRAALSQQIAVTRFFCQCSDVNLFFLTICSEFYVKRLHITWPMWIGFSQYLHSLLPPYPNILLGIQNTCMASVQIE